MLQSEVHAETRLYVYIDNCSYIYDLELSADVVHTQIYLTGPRGQRINYRVDGIEERGLVTGIEGGAAFYTDYMESWIKKGREHSSRPRPWEELVNKVRLVEEYPDWLVHRTPSKLKGFVTS